MNVKGRGMKKKLQKPNGDADPMVVAGEEALRQIA